MSLVQAPSPIETFEDVREAISAILAVVNGRVDQDNFQSHGVALGALPQVPQLKAYCSTSLAAFANGTFTNLSCDAEEWDLVPAGMSGQHDTTNKHVATCRVAGLYVVYAMTRFNVGSGPSYIRVRHTPVGGSTYEDMIYTSFATAMTVCQGSHMKRLGVGDTLTFDIANNSGGNLTPFGGSLTGGTSPSQFGWAWVSP